MAADLAQGMVHTAVHGWFCDTCTRPIHFFTKRQREQWLARQADPDQKIECRGWLPFRRECKGHLVHVEVVA